LMETLPRRQVYVVDFGAIAGGATEYGGTNPIVGRGRIVSLQFEIMRTATADLPLLTWWLRWASDIPTSAGEFAAGEVVFPSVNVVGLGGPVVQQGWNSGIVQLDGPFDAGPMGRRLTVSVANGAITGGRGWMAMLWERGVVLRRGRRIDD